MEITQFDDRCFRGDEHADLNAAAALAALFISFSASLTSRCL